MDDSVTGLGAVKASCGSVGLFGRDRREHGAQWPTLAMHATMYTTGPGLGCLTAYPLAHGSVRLRWGCVP